MESVWLGIDVGGTNVVMALGDGDGNAFVKKRIPTLAADGPARVLKRIIDAVETMLEETGTSFSRLGGIGLGVPGLVDAERGVVRLAVNLNWRQVAVSEVFRSHFGVPVRVDNDVRSAALGEYQFGAGKGFRHFLCLTLGTGIGSGMFLDGRLYAGATGSAGEIGHMVVEREGFPCTCGNRGCLETIASGPSLVRFVRERITEGVPTSLDNGEPLTVERIGSAFDVQDALAQEAIRRAGKYLGFALANAVHLLNVERVIIGGGVSLLGDRLFGFVRSEFQRCVLKGVGDGVDIVPAALGDEAGVMGALALARQAAGLPLDSPATA
ncbi:ROK family protein [Polycladomyces sp. WAk]|uniref:ROK family protein n=1 Tax=Polycladomyces zharkentensis TaxID=2807616 RepID=A0ABS2WGJ6_9BACL|nr:ROK family protein [Polycladomyces sp. WAk]MBN2908683.1 ROK family protein [Polycladomyces sp. WAk]